MQRSTNRLIVFDHSRTCIGNNTKRPKFTAHPLADKFLHRFGLKFPFSEDVTSTGLQSLLNGNLSLLSKDYLSCSDESLERYKEYRKDIMISVAME